MLHFSTVVTTVNENTWNNRVVEECDEKGRDASPLAKYAASKVLAEKGTIPKTILKKDRSRNS